MRYHCAMPASHSMTGNRTLVSRVTGGDTSHYTITDGVHSRMAFSARPILPNRSCLPSYELEMHPQALRTPGRASPTSSCAVLVPGFGEKPVQPKTSDDTKRRPAGANVELSMVILVAIIGWSKKFIGICSNDGPFVGSTGIWRKTSATEDE